MLKQLFYVLLFSLSLTQTFSQVLYSERFNTLALTTGTNTTLQTYLYSDVPTTMFTINVDTLRAEITNGNYPFKASGQQQKAWLGYVPVGGTDTFAVSTSWLKPIGIANAWLITPTINNITANSVLNWEAMAPDINNSDGYEVYVTTNTSATPVIGDFSNLVFSRITESNSWQTRGISLASFAGQNIRIAFKNNSTDKYQLWLDDIKVENITNGFDVATLSHSIYKYSTISANNTIAAIFKNNGFSPITNLTINYKMDNGSIISETKILSPALNYLESRELTFSTLYNSTVPIYNGFKIWSSTINAQADQVASNDTITGSITISLSSPAKKVLVEQFTSAKDAASPNGQIMMQSIVSTNTNVIATSIHLNDSLGNRPIHTSLQTVFNSGSTTPTAMIDRYLFTPTSKRITNTSNWSSYITQRQLMKVPATVTVTNVLYNSSTRQIDVTVSANFVGDVKGEYRFNLYVKENNVYGPIADSSDNMWNQYNGLYNIPSSQYYQYGNFDVISGEYIMSAASYKHQNVIHDMRDGWMGDPTPVPTNSTTIGQTYSKNYSFILPTATSGEFRYNADNVYLIGVLSEYDTNYYNGLAILNADQQKLTGNPEALVGIKENQKNNIQLNVFPNPTSDICHLNFNLENNEYVKINIYNALGELVYIETKNISAGNVDYILNLTELHSGNYSVQVSFKNNTITKKLTIIK